MQSPSGVHVGIAGGMSVEDAMIGHIGSERPEMFSIGCALMVVGHFVAGLVLLGHYLGTVPG